MATTTTQTYCLVEASALEQLLRTNFMLTQSTLLFEHLCSHSDRPMFLSAGKVCEVLRIDRNWGDEKEVSDCTMRERMLRTFDMDPASRWNFKGYKPDIVVVKLGSNDFSTGFIPPEKSFNESYAKLLDQLREAYGPVPVLCVAPSDNTVILGYLETFLRDRQDPNLHVTAMLPGITDWDSDMGANFHPNHWGHRKMAMAVIPYIATITGWEIPAEAVE